MNCQGAWSCQGSWALLLSAGSMIEGDENGKKSVCGKSGGWNKWKPPEISAKTVAKGGGSPASH